MYGSTCARAITGAKPKHPRLFDRVKRDSLTGDLFEART
jgi:hypothetical protein